MKKIKRKQQGYALLCTMFIVAILTVAVGSMVQVGQQRAFSAQRLTNDIKALSYAEAAIDMSKAVLRDDFSKASDGSNFELSSVTNGGGQASLIPAGNQAYSLVLGNAGGDDGNPDTTGITSTYDEGSFTVTITPIENRYVVVNAKGKHGSKVHETEVLFEDMNATDQPTETDNGAWENTIFAASTLNMGGNGDVDGSLHSNGEMRLNGNCEISPGPVNLTSSTKIRINGNVKVDGSFTAPVIQVNGNKESGASYNQTSVAPQDFPSYDLAELHNEAMQNGIVINGNKTYNGDKSWANKVVWIGGNLKIKGNAALSGGAIVVAEGSIDLRGNCNANTGAANTFISRDSSIKVAGNVEVNGLLYAPGDITLSGNVKLEGQIISGEDVKINGNVDVINYNYSGPETDTGDAPQDVQVSAWQK